MDFIITTAGNGDGDTWKTARELAVSLDKPAVLREKHSLETLRAEHGVVNLLVVGRNKISLVTPQGEYYFHPSMAKLRIKQLARGLTDPMVEAMVLQPGDTILDCTLGLAADALVSSYVTGPRGRVVGLEGVKILAVLVEKGLQTYRDTNPEVTAAASRIEVQAIHHLEYLINLPDKSFDVVYFDPSSPSQDGQKASPDDFRNEVFCHSLEGGYTVILIRFKDINHMVGYPLPLFHGRLSSPDIHIFVDLHGITGDNLPIDNFSKFNADSRFTHRRRADYDD